VASDLRLMTGTGNITSPGDGVGRGQRRDEGEEGKGMEEGEEGTHGECRREVSEGKMFQQQCSRAGYIPCCRGKKVVRTFTRYATLSRSRFSIPNSGIARHLGHLCRPESSCKGEYGV